MTAKIKWYNLVWGDYSEEEQIKPPSYEHPDYGIDSDVAREKANKAWNTMQYNMIPAEGKEELDRYWEMDWKMKLRQQKGT